MKNYKKDWTQQFSRKKLSNQSNILITNIISSIFLKKIKFLNSFFLSEKEIGQLFHWSLYIATNTFIERLVRTIYKNKIKENEYNLKSKEYTYYTSLNDFSINYYNNNELNLLLISDIENIIFNNKNIDQNFNKFTPKKPQKNYLKELLSLNYSLQGLSNFLKRKLKFLQLRNINLKNNNIDFLFDNSKWLNLIFDEKNKIIELKCGIYDIDTVSRSELRACFFKEFYKFLNTFQTKNKLSNETKKLLSNLFSLWVDCSFPQSIVEGLRDRIDFYIKYTKKYQIKHIHSCIGFYFNENIKIISILAKRKKAKLIGHEHGVNNFQDHFPNNRLLSNNYKSLIRFNYEDIYFAWGYGQLSSHWNKVEAETNTKIYNFGSVYLDQISKNNNKKKINNNIELLYISGPNRKHQVNLEDMTIEKNISHKINISHYLRKLLITNNKLRITYKPFMDTDLKEDQTIKNLQDLFDAKRIELTDIKPIKIMKNFDLVFFDMISTGFVEAIHMNIPSLIFGNKFYYNQASIDGKKINKKLEENGILFYDLESGIKSFNDLLNNNFKFLKSTNEVFEKFKKINSFPIGKELFLKKMNNVL